jgi:hypothetical protein
VIPACDGLLEVLLLVVRILRSGIDLAGPDALNVGRHADDGVGMDAPQMCLDEMVGDDAGVLGRHIAPLKDPSTRASNVATSSVSKDSPVSSDERASSDGDQGTYFASFAFFADGATGTDLAASASERSYLKAG